MLGAPRLGLLAVGGIGGFALAAVLLRGGPTPPATTVTASEPALELSGPGTLTTAPFSVSGGTYRARWEILPGTGGCTFGGSVVGSAGSFNADLAGIKQTPRGEGATGETYLYRVPPGPHYLKVSSNCAWRVSLERQ